MPIYTIEGNIGVGKTTFINIIKEANNHNKQIITIIILAPATVKGIRNARAINKY